jgi:DUF1680 family protein
MLRIPGWCAAGASVLVNGEPSAVAIAPGAYAEVRRTWHRGDILQLNLPMPVRRVLSHPAVEGNVGRVALMRGPLLYCVEQADNPDTDLRQIAIPDDATIEAEFRGDLLGGVVALTAETHREPLDESWSGMLYQMADREGYCASRALGATVPPSPTAAEGGQGGEGETGEGLGVRAATAIPYHAWANRAPGPMRVWLRRLPANEPQLRQQAAATHAE